jgi:predicted transcriptional regulator
MGGRPGRQFLGQLAIRKSIEAYVRRARKKQDRGEEGMEEKDPVPQITQEHFNF